MCLGRKKEVVIVTMEEGDFEKGKVRSSEKGKRFSERKKEAVIGNMEEAEFEKGKV